MKKLLYLLCVYCLISCSGVKKQTEHAIKHTQKEMIEVAQHQLQEAGDKVLLPNAGSLSLTTTPHSESYIHDKHEPGEARN